MGRKQRRGGVENSKETLQMARQKPVRTSADPNERERQKKQEILLQQERWLGPNPTAADLEALRQDTEAAEGLVSEHRTGWADSCRRLAEMIRFGHVDFEVEMQALYLLDSSDLRWVSTVLSNPWAEPQLPRELVRAIAATVEHASCIAADESSDLSVIERGLRNAADIMAMPAPRATTTSMHESKILAALKRHGRLGSSDLWAKVQPCHVGQSAHQKSVSRLVVRGLVKRHGKGRATEYSLP
ncbi:MAG: hypothetical protein IT457_23970 [Planctomycetes bacterium]|nr:hypothetical protein [Planctomycetota bacterium]